MIDFKLLKESEKLDYRIDTMIDSSPVSDYEQYVFMQSRKKRKENLTYADLDSRLKNIFKTLSGELFIDKRPDFERIKKQLLKKYPITESKLRQHFSGETLIKENAEYIRNVLL